MSDKRREERQEMLEQGRRVREELRQTIERIEAERIARQSRPRWFKRG